MPNPVYPKKPDLAKLRLFREYLREYGDALLPPAEIALSWGELQWSLNEGYLVWTSPASLGPTDKPLLPKEEPNA